MPANSEERLDAGLVRLALVLLVGAMAALLNTTIVAVVLPELGRALAAPVAAVHWVTSAHLLAMAAVIPTMGWLVARVGTRTVWLGALLLFAVGTGLCAAAWSLPSLVVFRIVQGLGAGLVLPLVQAVLAEAAGPRRLGRAMALVGVPGQLAPVLGPAIGAFVVGTYGWRWAFLALLPVTAVALGLAVRVLPRARSCRPPRLDALGLALAVPAVVALLFGLTEAGRGDGGWGTVRVLLIVGGGAALLAGFALHARRAGRHALVDVGLLRVRSFRSAAMLMFLFGFSLFGPMLVLPVFVDQVRGNSATEAGVVLALQGIGTAASLAVAGRWTDHHGPRVVAISGHIATAAATVVLATAGPHSPFWLLAAAVVLFGAGLGAAGVAVSGAAYRDLRPDAIAGATSLLNVLQRIGAAAGTAGLAAVLALGATRGMGPAVQIAFLCTTAAALVGLVPGWRLPTRPCASPATVSRSDPCTP
jgi:EmrB/QacA subfamily drug resistance transporter